MKQLGELIYYVRENKQHSAKVLSIMHVQNEKEQPDDKFYTRFGPAGIFYSTVHGVISDKEVDRFITDKKPEKLIE